MAWSPVPPVPAERSFLYCPIGLRLVDEFTGAAPIGWVRATLQVEDGPDWRETGIRVTPSGIFAYPGLERRADPAGQPPRRYRIQLTAQYYLPEYLWNTEGIEFDAHPYNDTNPPSVIVPGAQDALLLPAPRYPFAAGLRVLRGRVTDNTGAPAPDTLVALNPTERVLTDAAGSYRLPLRWPALNANIVIDATSLKLGLATSINVNLPADLAMVQNIQLP